VSFSNRVNITSLRKKGRRRVAEVAGAGVEPAEVVLHADIVAEFALSAPSEMDSERWKEIVAANDFRLAWETVLSILSSGNCDSRGLKRKLARKGFPAEVADRAVAEAARLALIDDDAFVRGKAEACLARCSGPRKALAKLIEGGVPRDEAGEVVAAVYADGAELEAAERAAAKKTASLRRSGDDPRKKLEKLKRHLAGRGFSWEVISRVVESVDFGPVPGEDQL